MFLEEEDRQLRAALEAEEDEEDEDEDEDDDEDEEVGGAIEHMYTDVPWCILLVLAFLTLIVANVPKYYELKQSREAIQTLDYFHWYHVTTYYGNITDDDREHFDKLQRHIEDTGIRNEEIFFIRTRLAFFGITFSLFVALVNKVLNSLNLVNDDTEMGVLLKIICCAFNFGMSMMHVMSMLLETFALMIIDPPPWNFHIFLIVALCYFYIFLFFYYFTKMVIAKFTAQILLYDVHMYYEVFLGAIVNTARYHAGTICFNATVILPPLVAVKTIKWRSHNLRTIHGFGKSKSRIERFIGNLYMTFFIANYSSIITATSGHEGVVDATQTILDALRSGLSLRRLRVFQNLRLKFVLSTSVFVFFLTYAILRIQLKDLDVFLAELASKINWSTMIVIIGPLVNTSFGTIFSTRAICQWLIENQAVAAG